MTENGLNWKIKVMAVRMQVFFGLLMPRLCSKIMFLFCFVLFLLRCWSRTLLSPGQVVCAAGGWLFIFTFGVYGSSSTTFSLFFASPRPDPVSLRACQFYDSWAYLS